MTISRKTNFRVVAPAEFHENEMPAKPSWKAAGSAGAVGRQALQLPQRDQMWDWEGGVRNCVGQSSYISLQVCELDYHAHKFIGAQSK